MTECQYRSCQSSHGGYVCAYFPPDVQYAAKNTSHECGYKDTKHELGGIHIGKQQYTCNITGNGNHVRSVPMFAMAELPMCPFVYSAKYIDGNSRYYYGEH